MPFSFSSRSQHLNGQHVSSFSEVDIASQAALTIKKADDLSLRIRGLEKQKEKIIAAITTLSKPKGFITAIASAWGRCPKFIKLIVGLCISVPLFVSGIFMHVGALILAGVSFATFYGPTTIVLDALHQRNKEIANTFIGGWEVLLTELFNTLETFHLLKDAFIRIEQELRDGLEQFKLENQHMQAENVNFAKENKKLAIKIKALSAATRELSSATEMSRETQDEFLKRLEAFVQEKSAGIDAIFERFGQAEEELEQTKQALTASNQLYQALLEQQAGLLTTQAKHIQELKAQLESQHKLTHVLEKVSQHRFFSHTPCDDSQGNGEDKRIFFSPLTLQA